MRILVAHNFYQQPGGEDRVFADEMAMLSSRGHQVASFTMHNDEIVGRSRLRVAAWAFWNAGAAAALARIAGKMRPDIVHFHNTFPLMSPACHAAARRSGAAVVQTLHNFRLLCPAATLGRDGQICQECLGRRLALAGIRHRCYRGSRSATLATAAVMAAHGAAGTFRRKVDAFIALNELAREKFIAGGLPPDRIFVKPNFIFEDPGPGAGDGGYAVFVGRLVGEKGIATLLAAWRRIGSSVPLKVIGDGPMAGAVVAAAKANAAIHWLGRLPPAQVRDLIGNARLLICPSIWYEGCPMAIVEALARGTPVIGSRLEPIIDMIDDGQTGVLFEPGDEADLATAVLRLAHDQRRLAMMRQQARRYFLAHGTAESNYPMLAAIYDQALSHRHGGRIRAGQMSRAA